VGAIRDACGEFLGPEGFVVFMKTHKGFFDAKVSEEHSAMASVFGSNQVGRF
jgi:hypothetical protein